MAAWSRKTLKFCEQFLRFFGKTTPYGKIFKILFRKFTWRHRLTLLCWNFVKFIRGEIGKIVRYLPSAYNKKNHKISAASRTVAHARIVPKICHGQPPTFGSHCSRFHPNRFTFGGVIAECANTVFCPVKYSSMPEAKHRFVQITKFYST